MTETKLPDSEQIRDFVRARYGAIAEQAGTDCGCGPACCDDAAPADAPKPAATGCCAPTCCGDGKSSGEKLGDSAEELASAPAGADLGLGCGIPLAIASIQPGETVLDLGSGAGFRQIEIKPRETSRALINEWTEDTRAGDFVVSALITAVKPA